MRTDSIRVRPSIILIALAVLLGATRALAAGTGAQQPPPQMLWGLSGTWAPQTFTTNNAGMVGFQRQPGTTANDNTYFIQNNAPCADSVPGVAAGRYLTRASSGGLEVGALGWGNDCDVAGSPTNRKMFVEGGNINVGAAVAVINGTIVGSTLTVNSVTSGAITTGSIDTLTYAGSSNGVLIVSGGPTTYTLSSAPGNVGPIAMTVYQPVQKGTGFVLQMSYPTGSYASLPSWGPIVSNDADSGITQFNSPSFGNAEVINKDGSVSIGGLAPTPSTPSALMLNGGLAIGTYAGTVAVGSGGIAASGALLLGTSSSTYRANFANGQFRFDQPSNGSSIGNAALGVIGSSSANGLCYVSTGANTICLGDDGNGLITTDGVSIKLGRGMTGANPSTYTADFIVGATNSAITPLTSGSTFTTQWDVHEGNYGYATPTTGGTVSYASFNTRYIIDPAGTLATLTVALPQCSGSAEGRIVAFGFTQAITALTVSSASSTVKNAPTTAAAGNTFGYLCKTSNTTWYPVKA